ncbi:hypothetical protein OIU84_008612 [Salix udensis]|uniref:GRAS family transcription factor n=1 Tax=Salix udensis TaxID=889485 RepID=A0AAD6JPG4_9ROSI|nr:hypothetical protein OIU84_008612 [Salix udensis]
MFDHASVSFSPNRNLFDGYKLNDTMSDPNPSFNSSNPEPPNDSASPSSSSNSSSESYGPSNNVTLKFISDVLLEEDLEGKTCMLQDCLALQAAEKSFYDVLGQEYPHSSNQIRSCFDQNFESPDNGFTWRSGVDSSKSYPPGNNLVEKSDWVFDQSDLDFYQAQASPVLPLERTLLGPDLHSAVHPFERATPPTLWTRTMGDHSPNSSRGRKNHQREDSDGLEEERSKKQSALSPADSELSELLDEVLLCSVGQNESTSCSLLGNSQNGAAGNEQRKGSSGRTARGKKRGKKGEVVDSSSLLIQCAQAVAIGDQRTASELLQQIRQHSSPHGDANQRLAHYFANALDTRLAGAATPAFTLFVSPRTSAADILKAYQRLSERPGGPPKLRITGIELPQPGFRPAERVEETGRRLERYEDLKIDKDEKVVVNCLYRLRNLPDDTIVENSARDAVLKLINEIKPDMFIHGVVNGNFNAPFFVTRFREALYHFSSLFDMFEATVPRKDEHRVLFEKEQYGRDITNVIACEGKARVERPETYKQWQSRNLRAGFSQLPLDKELFKDVRSVVKSEYDNDFVVDADGQWVLQGWKGRIIYALSIWKPVQE